MQLSYEMLERFVGGDLEVFQAGTNEYYRGRIKKITYSRNGLGFDLVFLAKNDGGAHEPSDTWTVHPLSSWEFTGSDFEVAPVLGTSKLEIMYTTAVKVVLIPKEVGQLDPRFVVGICPD